MSKDTKRRDTKGRVLRTGESQRKDGTYQYRYMQNGKRECVYAPTLKELREKEDEIQKRRSLGILTNNSNITLLEAVKRSVAIRNNCKINTLISYQGFIKVLSKQPFMNTSISKVTCSNARLWFVEMQNAGYKKGTLRNLRGLIRSSLEPYVEDKVIANNPFDFKLTFLREDTEKRNAIPPEQWHEFIEYLKSDRVSGKHLSMFVILYETGMRVGELCGITIEDVDLVNKCVHVRRQVCFAGNGVGYYVSPPKTNSGYRTIPFTPEAENAFRSAIKNRDPHCRDVDGVSGFIFSCEGHPLHNRIVDTKFSTAVRRYNARHPAEKIHASPHYLRHSFATNISKMGISLKTAQYLMGHADVNVTLDIYTHIDIEHALKEFRQACDK